MSSPNGILQLSDKCNCDCCLSVECPYRMPYEGVTIAGNFMYLFIWRWCRPKWRTCWEIRVHLCKPWGTYSERKIEEDASVAHLSKWPVCDCYRCRWNACVSSDHKFDNMLIGMFHHNNLDKHKVRVTTSVYKPSGTCRVVFATNALGMGINFKDYWPPRNIKDFVQEIGRAGRDGRKAVSASFYQWKHLQKCEKAVKGMPREHLFAKPFNVRIWRT